MDTVIAALNAVPNACLLAWGWRRGLYALIVGAIAALALPPVNFILSLAFALPCLVWLLDGAVGSGEASALRRLRLGFGLGWLFGLGYFLAGLWWIGAAFLVDGERYAWLLPVAVLAMPMGLALFHGLACGCAALLWSNGAHRIAVLAIFLSTSDWLRGHVLTGFPWNTFGAAVSGSLEISQFVSVAGADGLGLLVLLIAAAPAVLTEPGRQKWRIGAVALATTLGVVGFGVWRLEVMPDPGLSELDIRLVQPAIAQSEKWKPENRDRIFSDYLDLSSRPQTEGGRVGARRLIVWPESALPFLLTQTPSALVAISALLNDQHQLVTGAIRAEATEAQTQYYNSLFLFGPDGTIVGSYDKVHLVPFGEYLPLADWLDALGLSKLVEGPGAFSSGYGRRSLQLQGGETFLPLICYEVIFSNYSNVQSRRPDFLLNLTNDAWFGRTAGPFQHLAQARMRAIEQGLPLVRAANTGVSAVFDAKGRYLARVELEEKGIEDVALSRALSSTIFSRIGGYAYALMLFLLSIFSVYCQYNRGSRYN
ncbi:apolipoprotein N-acyltransferase [Roseibium sp. CAU 1637]|uniref:Apolipoprotein N-acyltransferase n=1 Tax=Roseibium limicola TaxID=2816037 RepID=A0A939EQU2_9HYPH|nr:apolipoprotein N-acyltransferase [Roseibium limicola]MBO0346412.1 apolipoprotein N-acyltransferase [Roseibium limicola]